MIRSNLFDAVLKKPAERGSNRLLILSGYASAAMAYRHFESIPESVRVELIIGMSPNEGIGRGDHLAFQKLAAKDFRGRFDCRYLVKPPSHHGKVYVWEKARHPAEAFVGSANYTQVAFFSNTTREEVVVPYNPAACMGLYNSLLANSIPCTDPNVERAVRVHDGRRRRPRGFYPEIGVPKPPTRKMIPVELGECVTLPLLDRSGQASARAGLNWGQRPRRSGDEAYIPVPSAIARAGFFPPRGIHFTLATDDGKVFDCVAAQQNDKAIETPQSNALLGKYFRQRMGLPLGVFVKRDHLLRYGRADVTICKIDDENYQLDFSPKRS